MIVVSNTSPITNLTAIGQFNLLQFLFGELHVPEAVVAELSFGGVEWPGLHEINESEWVFTTVVKDRRLVEALRLELDRGEAETIALALQLQADLVLIDEKPGRFAAQHFGLKVMGVVGMIVRAKQLGYIAATRPSLDALRETAGFYIDQSLYTRALELASEL